MNLVLETRHLLTADYKTPSECQCYEYYFPEVKILKQKTLTKGKKVIMVF